MKPMKQLLMVATMAAVAGLTACGGGDDTTINYTGGAPVGSTGGGTGGGTIGGGTQPPADCPSWSTQVFVAGTDVCQLPSNILVDRTLTANNIWYLANQVRVGNGNEDVSANPAVLLSGAPVVNAKLTIEAGTRIWGKAFSPANNTVGNLVITRGSTIEAIGTQSDPIIFSSPDAGDFGSAEWGGLILQGYGTSNLCPPAPGPCNYDGEGNSGKAGGYDDGDSSGVLEYVIVTEGGAEFAVGNEINGISFISVGSGTRVNYVQVNDNSDDGVEFYGGAVSAKYLVLTGNRDDSVDWDEGWAGNLQYVLVIQENEPQTEGNAIEADSEGNVTLGDFSVPTIANATFIGAGENDNLWRLKESTGGFFLNTIGTFSSETLPPPGGARNSSCTDVQDIGTQTNIGTGRLDFNNVIIGCVTFGNAAANGLIDTTTVLADPALDVNYASQAAEAINKPLDVAGFNAGNAFSTADPNFLDDTDYIGAVDPSAGSGWFGFALPGSL